jgi:hypothetical protein
MTVAFPGTYNTKIFPGSKWELTLTYEGANLSDGVWEMQLRDSSGSLQHTLATGDGIVSSYVDPDTEITLTIGSNVTKDILASGRYDLEYTPSGGGVGDTVRILMGRYSVISEVTV